MHYSSHVWIGEGVRFWEYPGVSLYHLQKRMVNMHIIAVYLLLYSVFLFFVALLFITEAVDASLCCIWPASGLHCIFWSATGSLCTNQVTYTQVRLRVLYFLPLSWYPMPCSLFLCLSLPLPLRLWRKHSPPAPQQHTDHRHHGNTSIPHLSLPSLTDYPKERDFLFYIKKDSKRWQHDTNALLKASHKTTRLSSN